jgi:FkbM family methyltransferase
VFDRLQYTIALNSPSRKPELWARPLYSLNRRLRYTAMRLRGDESIEMTRNFRIAEQGIRIESSMRDYIGKSLYLYGVWEIHETRFMQQVLRPGDTFIDVGANVGYHTLIASRLVGDQGTVLSLEPAEATRAMLLRNLAINGTANVVVEAAAVTDFEGVITLFEPKSKDLHVLSSTIPSAQLSDARTEVTATTLDSCVTQHRLADPTMVKVDVEGAELAVFRGADRMLASDTAPVLMFESHGDRILPIHERLRGYGYSIFSLHYSRRSGVRLSPADATMPAAGKVDYVAMQERHRPSAVG